MSFVDHLTIPMGEYGEDELSFGIEPEPAGNGLVLSVTAGGEEYYLYERDWLKLRTLLDTMDVKDSKPSSPLDEVVRRLALAESMMNIARQDAFDHRSPGEAHAWSAALLWLRHVYMSVNDAIRARHEKEAK